MKLRQLGKSGLLVSEICLGTMTFGGQTPVWDARQIMDQYIHQGGNFIDTANAYNGGKAEMAVGQWIGDGQHREHVILATKTYLPEDGNPNHRRLSRSAIMYSVEQSLQRLHTDYIDLYYTNYWDAHTPLEETLAAMEQLVQQGKVRYLACSNLFAWQVMKALGLQQMRGWSPLVTVQVQYNLIERSIEREITPLVQHEGLGLIAWSPLAGGFLTGKHQPNKPLNEKTRLGMEGEMPYFYRNLSLNERGWAILQVVTEIASTYNVAPAQVALAWTLSKPYVSATITGVSHLNQIDDNLAAGKLQLSPDDLRRLDEVSEIEASYPGYLMDMTRWG